jgi:hypothetical protein
MARPFDRVLRLPGAQPEDFALAIATEFDIRLTGFRARVN